MTIEGDREVFLSWHDSRRSRSLAERLELDSHTIVADRKGPTRHVLGTLLTAWFLAHEKPDRIWYQFSLLLGAVLGVYKSLRPSTRLVADTHTKALKRSGPPLVAWGVRALKRFALGQADQVVVTNSENASFAQREYGVQPTVLPDPLPTVPSASNPLSDGADVVFVCSFASDEPVELILDVAESLQPDYSVAITGDFDLLPEETYRTAYDSEVFTGFLPEADYWSLLRSAEAIVVVSTEPACLPCGAYEAIAVGNRPVLADDPKVRELFGNCARYSPLDRQSMVEEIRRATTDPKFENLARRYQRVWLDYWHSTPDSFTTRNA